MMSADGHVVLLDLECAVAGCGGDAGLEFGRPRRVRCPDRKSRTWPDSSGRTQVWQMPIRQPNGIWMPTFSPASRSEVAPSTSIGLVGDRERDGAALAALVGAGDDEPLHVQVVLGTSGVGPTPSRPCRASRAGRTPRWAGPSSPATMSSSSLEVEVARLARSAAGAAGSRSAPRPGLAVRRGRSRPPPTAPSGCGRCRGSDRAAFSDRSIAMTGVMPLPARDEQQSSPAAGRVARSRPWGPRGERSFPGCTPFTRCVDRKPSGVALTVIEMSFLSRTRDRGQRVGPPVPPPVDAQADADVLAGLVVAGEAPARLDRDRWRSPRSRCCTSTTSPRSSRADHSGLSSLR